MLVVKKLSPDKYSRLRDIFDAEFDSDLPEPANSEIFVAYESGRMTGFVLCEDVKIIGQIYVVPEKRQDDSSVVRTLITEVRNRYDGNEVVGAVASESRFEKLFTGFGMHKISGVFYRKNI